MQNERDRFKQFDKENHIYVEIHIDNINNEASLNLIEELKSTYGDAISFGYIDGIPVDTLEEIGLSDFLPSPLTPDENSFSPLWAVGLIEIPLLVFGTFFALKKRLAPALQSNTGAVVTKGKSLSTKNVEELVKESSLSVPDGVDKKIMETIESK